MNAQREKRSLFTHQQYLVRFVQMLARVEMEDQLKQKSIFIFEK